VGARTSPASLEQLARHLLGCGVVTTVLAVPMGQRGPASRLDRFCTVADTGVVIMVPAQAFTLTALTITSRQGDLCVSRPRPFLEAAANAVGLDGLTVIGTGIEAQASQAGHASNWDDGGNALVIGERAILCSERNVETNARLTAAGFEVITVPGDEVGALRGGPRGMCSPICRDPVTAPDLAEVLEPGQPATAQQQEQQRSGTGAVPEPAEPASGQSGRVSQLAPMR
jgi:arginine deiminase